jgi:hypothetical protein
MRRAKFRGHFQITLLRKRAEMPNGMRRVEDDEDTYRLHLLRLLPIGMYWCANLCVIVNDAVAAMTGSSASYSSPHEKQYSGKSSYCEVSKTHQVTGLPW